MEPFVRHMPMEWVSQPDMGSALIVLAWASILNWSLLGL